MLAYSETPRIKSKSRSLARGTHFPVLASWWAVMVDHPNVYSTFLNVMESYSSRQPYNVPVITRSSRETIPQGEYWSIVSQWPKEGVLLIRNTEGYSP